MALFQPCSSSAIHARCKKAIKLITLSPATWPNDIYIYYTSTGNLTTACKTSSSSSSQDGNLVLYDANNVHAHNWGTPNQLVGWWSSNTNGAGSGPYQLRILVSNVIIYMQSVQIVPGQRFNIDILPARDTTAAFMLSDGLHCMSVLSKPCIRFLIDVSCQREISDIFNLIQ